MATTQLVPVMLHAATPINDRIIVRMTRTPDYDAQQFPTLAKLGLVAPASAEEKETVCGTMVQYENAAHRGTVVAVGPGKLLQKKCADCGNWIRRPMSVKPGDKVVFGRFADYGEDGLVVLQEDDVLGIEE